jgi:hypothetical protein
MPINYPDIPGSGLLNREQRDAFWAGLCKRFPNVPADWSITPGDNPISRFATALQFSTSDFRQTVRCSR